MVEDLLWFTKEWIEIICLILIVLAGLSIMVFGFGRATKGVVGLITLVIMLMFFNSSQIEEHAATNILTEDGGLGDSLFTFQEKHKQLDKFAKDEGFIAYSFETENSKLEASFFEFREKRAFQLNVYPTEPLESTEDFVHFLEPYLPIDSIYRNKVENGDGFLYFYQSEKLERAFDEEFSWGEKRGTFIISIPKDLQMAQLVVSKE
ncbi:hypothetical protein RRV45_10805 [Bacillus sp. DTU_2020_1000418_1_SI_GHA_SEK_038]|uniref:hypothetical protein n=1 Tax=Bacillus sp. DTU_2020_1000418_1_SI_GHA_SEK_038 TaxID=3077585 RepID=UPI0028E93E50|nr:hypothetical protein [Bacillus sp. DTU_2020_1000418_1_SI_GHA_SEK_038]WNS77444.1 hypothetical protein RRV45_10805 [Bacillus sp. DTU_2020_1000418_1_SI_GHA_SEK_038]